MLKPQTKTRSKVNLLRLHPEWRAKVGSNGKSSWIRVFRKMKVQTWMKIAFLPIMYLIFLLIVIGRRWNTAHIHNADNHGATSSLSSIPNTIYIVHKYDLCDVTKPSHLQHPNWRDDHFHFQLMINVQKIKALNPDYNVICYDDNSAYDYILNVKQDPVFAAYFENEQTGTYKSDLFRIFLLFHEGGYYFDSDMEPRMSLNEVISSSSSESPITFISAIAEDKQSVFQSILGATKGNSVLERNLELFREYYSTKKRLPNNMGSVLLGNALQSIVGKPLGEMAGETQIGNQNIRMLEERKYDGVDAKDILSKRIAGKSWDYIFELAVYDSVSGKYPFWSRFTGYGNAWFRKRE